MCNVQEVISDAKSLGTLVIIERNDTTAHCQDNPAIPVMILNTMQV